MRVNPECHPKLGEIAGVFLRLGVFGFGGPIAVMAMMEEECCGRRAWVNAAQFNEIYAVCKVLPGPVGTQMAIYLGRERGGTVGGLLAGILFVLPAFVMVLGFSVVYAHSGLIKNAGPALEGLQAAALAVILLSTWNLSKSFRTQAQAWGIAAAVTCLVYLNPRWEPLLILGAGLFGAFRMRARTRAGSRTRLLLWLMSLGAFSAMYSRRVYALTESGQALGVWNGKPLILMQLFWMCFKAGAFVFGTGLAVVPVLEGDAVRQFHWLTHSQFMDGLALGQVTPGPVVITSTFIGYMAAGMAGAFAASIGMFLPPFFNVLVLVPRVWRKFSGTPAAQGFSAFAIPAVVGGILGTTIQLGRVTINSPSIAAVFVASLGVAYFLRPPAWILIPGAGIVSGLLSYLH